MKDLFTQEEDYTTAEKVIITIATIGLVLSSLLVIGLSVFWLIVK